MKNLFKVSKITVVSLLVTVAIFTNLFATEKESPQAVNLTFVLSINQSQGHLEQDLSLILKTIMSDQVLKKAGDTVNVIIPDTGFTASFKVPANFKQQYINPGHRKELFGAAWQSLLTYYRKLPKATNISGSIDIIDVLYGIQEKKDDYKTIIIVANPDTKSELFQENFSSNAFKNLNFYWLFKENKFSSNAKKRSHKNQLKRFLKKSRGNLASYQIFNQNIVSKLCNKVKVSDDPQETHKKIVVDRNTFNNAVLLLSWNNYQGGNIDLDGHLVFSNDSIIDFKPENRQVSFNGLTGIFTKSFISNATGVKNGFEKFTILGKGQLKDFKFFITSSQALTQTVNGQLEIHMNGTLRSIPFQLTANTPKLQLIL